MKKFKDNIDDFFKWVKGTELVELDDIDTSEDPVRPELTLGFRIMHGRKIFGLKYNNEIEAIVSGMDNILECACIGVPDDKTGEAIKLFVVKTDDAITETDVIEYCRPRLAAYKVPKQIEFMSELPKSTVGKILRRELR